jgi:holo-[acyl-carrier protein] synthase
MIIGIGMDLVEVQRLDRLLERYPERALRRLFTEREIAYCSKKESSESYAARFAAKEALFKALGTGWGEGTAFHEVEVLLDDFGAPSLQLHGETARIAATRGVGRSHVSLTHTSQLAAAYVVLEGASD